MLVRLLASSPSRRYMAQCFKINFDGFYFRSFILPERNADGDAYPNNAAEALDFYMREMDVVSCIHEVFPMEDLMNFREKT